MLNQNILKSSVSVAITQLMLKLEELLKCCQSWLGLNILTLELPMIIMHPL